MNKSPSTRLASINNVLNHIWFEDFDKEKLLEMKLHAPYYPKIKKHIKLKNTSLEEFLIKNAVNDKYSQVMSLEEEKDKPTNDLWYDDF